MGSCHIANSECNGAWTREREGVQRVREIQLIERGAHVGIIERNDDKCELDKRGFVGLRK